MRVRLALWLVAVASMAAAVAAVVLAALLPLDQGPADADAARPAMPATAPSDAASWFNDVATLDLRQPLTDARAPIATQATATPAPAADAAPGVELIGTAVEPGHCIGLFTLADGSLVLKPVGQVVGGARIVSITSDAATLEWHDRMIELKLPRPGGSTDLAEAPADSTPRMTQTIAHETASSVWATPAKAEESPPAAISLDEADLRRVLNAKPTLGDGE